MEKYGSERILTDGKQDHARKMRRKSDVLVDNRKEGRNTNESRNELSSHGILVLIAGIPTFGYRSINLNLIVLLVRAPVLTQVLSLIHI